MRPFQKMAQTLKERLLTPRDTAVGLIYTRPEMTELHCMQGKVSFATLVSGTSSIVWLRPKRYTVYGVVLCGVLSSRSELLSPGGLVCVANAAAVCLSELSSLHPLLQAFSFVLTRMCVTSNVPGLCVLVLQLTSVLVVGAISSLAIDRPGWTTFAALSPGGWGCLFLLVLMVVAGGPIQVWVMGKVGAAFNAMFMAWGLVVTFLTGTCAY